MAQCFVFFVAGFESVASTLSFVAHELAINQSVQQRLFDEIYEAHTSLAGEPMTYDRLQQLKYLDMVLSESMRMWPTAGIIDRICNRQTVLDVGEGRPGIKLNVGDTVVIPIYAIHRDAAYYPNPDRFDPERFNDTNVCSINASNYMPFGIGPRNCIASRFAVTECKALLYQLLLAFRLDKCDRTQDPLRLGIGLGAAAEKGFWLAFKRRDEI